MLIAGLMDTQAGHQAKKDTPHCKKDQMGQVEFPKQGIHDEIYRLCGGKRPELEEKGSVPDGEENRYSIHRVVASEGRTGSGMHQCKKLRAEKEKRG